MDFTTLCGKALGRAGEAKSNSFWTMIQYRHDAIDHGSPMSHERKHQADAWTTRQNPSTDVCNLLLPTLVLATGLLVFGCSMQQKRGSEVAEDGVAMSEANSSELYAEVVARMGPPESEEDFVMAWGEPEFRVELRNFFNRESIEAGEVTLRESTWSLDGLQNLTFWFQQKDNEWRRVHSLRWQDGDEF